MQHPTRGSVIPESHHCLSICSGTTGTSTSGSCWELKLWKFILSMLFCKLKYNPHWIAAPDVGNQPSPIGNLWGLIQIQHKLCALAPHTHFNGNCPKIPASHRDINRNYLHLWFPQRDIQFKILFYLGFLPQSTKNIRMRLQNPVRDGLIWLCIIYPAIWVSWSTLEFQID